MPALDRKTIVIMGGTSGLGLSAARACALEGAKVVVVGRSEQKVESAIKALGSQAAGLAGDAAEPATAPSAIELAVRLFGRLDGFYHVAGGSGRRFGDGPLDEISDEGWNKTLRLNLDSMFFSNRAAVRQLLKQGGGGSIVNCGSVLGYSPSPAYFATHAYAAAKAAAMGLTKSSAAYYAPRDIRFNLLAPGLVATPMSQRAQERPEILEFIRTKQPLSQGRIGVPEDLDAAVVWLLSDASKFVTGQVIGIDGGWEVSEGQLADSHEA
ncbi:MAG: SDR family oxidoreductase [Verrucomicrobia bacterium]|nr:SDR family oxidoreductase [Verrucomicrobiota bacterium]